jgi:hypothetical protein
MVFLRFFTLPSISLTLYSAGALLLFAACSNKQEQVPQLFYGECRLTVESKTDKAAIMVDGVDVGHDRVELNVPCGEKRIAIQKKGFVPFYNFVQVNHGQPVVLKVELEKAVALENEALSSDLIEKLRASQLALAKTAAGSSSGAGSSGAAVQNSSDWDNVEAWR